MNDSTLFCYYAAFILILIAPLVAFWGDGIFYEYRLRLGFIFAVAGEVILCFGTSIEIFVRILS